MIEQIMYFALGLLTAALVTIALLPALWRRAVRLTRQELEATLPLSREEIAAEKDQLRAGHAVELRRIETGREAAEAALQAAKTDIGRQKSEIQARDATIAAHLDTIADLTATLAARDSHITGLEQDIATLERERDNLATNLTGARMSNQALDQQAIALRQTAEQRQARLAELEAAGDSLGARLGEALAEAARLKDDSQMRSDELRQAARKLREAASHIAMVNRKLAAAEALANDHQAAIETLQAERLRLIDDAGQITRERDHERMERQSLAAEVERQTRRQAETAAALETARARATDQQREAAAVMDRLRQEKRQADQDLATFRLAAAERRSEQDHLAVLPDQNTGTGNHLGGDQAAPPATLAADTKPRTARKPRAPGPLI